MKKRHYLLNSVLALSMCAAPMMSVIATATPVFADGVTSEEQTYTITINNVESDKETYTAYQVFKGKLDTTGAVLSNIEWGNDVTSEGKKAVIDMLFKPEEDPDDEYDSEKFTAADVANKLANNESEALKVAALLVDNKGYLTGEGAKSTYDETNKYATIGNLQPGYYLIKNAGGSTTSTEKYILQVVNDVQVEPKKSDIPQAEKKVAENVKPVSDSPALITTDKMNDVADYDMNTAIPFELAAKVPAGVEHYSKYDFVFNDVLDQGFDLDEETIVVYNGTEPLNEEDYTLTVSDNRHSFSVTVPIKVKGEQSQKYEANSIIRVTYEAKLNANCEMNTTGNHNTFTLTYHNNPNLDSETETTPVDEVVVFTYDVDLEKVDRANPETRLTGAEFHLSKTVKETTDEGDTEEKTYWMLADLDENNVYRFTGWTDKEEDATDIKFSTENTYTIRGLDAGTYQLKETKAPDGYNLPTTSFDLTINADTKNSQNLTQHGTELDTEALTNLEVNGAPREDNVVQIGNTKGSTLPSTGGMGTTVLYTAGAALVGGAVILLVTNKRMKKED